MATAEPISPTPPRSGPRSGPHTRSRPGSRRRLRRLLLGLLLFVLAVLAIYWQPLNSYAVAGTSYAARVGCSCRYVGGRSLSDCRKDFESGMELVRLSEDEDALSVTAHFPLLLNQTAIFRKGEGCVLEPWTD